VRRWSRSRAHADDEESRGEAEDLHNEADHPQGAVIDRVLPLDEIVRAAEAELEFQERSYRIKRARLTPARRVEWEEKLDEWKRRVRMLRRDLPRLRAMDLRTRIRPEVFDERGQRLPPPVIVTVKHLGRESTLNYLDALRRPGESYGDAIRRLAAGQKGPPCKP
jgi:hypothetical protein